jgi:RNA polymerase sigma factor (TIGR02999 family)
MTVASPGEITKLLQAWSDGDATARDRLARFVYADLRRLAAARLRGGVSPSLNPSDLVQEAFVRLLGQATHWSNRAHFFAISAMMIRRVLVDRARARGARKRGGGDVRVSLTEVEAVRQPVEVDVIALNLALDELAAMDARQAQVVELRYFGGLRLEEIAEALQISVSTVKREWTSARLWLYRRLRRDTGRAGSLVSPER